jgi:hypothetical protein
MSDEPATKPMPTTKEDPAPAAQPPPKTNRFDVERAFAAMFTLVVIVLIVAIAFHDNSEGAAAVLGVAVPVLTAAIGLTAGLQVGEKSGQAAGDAKAASAASDERAKIQEAILPLTESLTARTEEVTQKLEQASSTAVGETERVISFEPEGKPADKIRFEGEVIDGLKSDAAQLAGLVQGLSQES